MNDKLVRTLAEVRAKGGLRREMTVAGVDVEARTVKVAFSSELEYRRWFGIEILGHEPGEADLSRLENNAAVLWMHDWVDQRGAVESVSIDGDKVGRATLRISRSEAGEELLQDVADGIKTKISVGYLVTGMKLIEEREDIDVYRVTEWQPYEISFVSVPADDTVGVGRAAEKPPEETNPDNNENKNRNDVSVETISLNEAKRTMKVINTYTADGAYVRAEVDDAGNMKVLETITPAKSANDQSRQIAAMGREYGRSDLAALAIEAGKTPEEFGRQLLAEFAIERSKKPLADQVTDANIGLNDKEVRQFSLMRAIRAFADPANKKYQSEAAFELEASRAAADKYGKSGEAIIIPNDVLMRTFSTTNPTGGPGSNIVANNLLANSFIELLRNRAWLMKRARSLGGLVGNIDIPRQNAATQAYWVGEGGEPNSSQPGADQIAFSPKTLGATVDITRRLLLQSTPDAEALVRDDIVRVMALELDRVGIYGTGTSNQPKGIKNMTGINAVDFAVAGKPTFIELVGMETQIALDNADVDSMSYAFNAAIRGYTKTALKFPDSASDATIWEPGKTVNGYATDVSNQLATGDVFFGNWQDMIIAMWAGLQITVDPYSLSKSGGIRLVALQDVDINVRHVESFCYGSDTVS